MKKKERKIEKGYEKLESGKIVFSTTPPYLPSSFSTLTFNSLYGNEWIVFWSERKVEVKFNSLLRWNLFESGFLSTEIPRFLSHSSLFAVDIPASFLIFSRFSEPYLHLFPYVIVNTAPLIDPISTHSHCSVPSSWFLWFKKFAPHPPV